MTSTILFLTLALVTPAQAGGGGQGELPVERLYTCWECSITVIEHCPAGIAFDTYLPVDFVAYGLSGEDCEANLVDDVLTATSDPGFPGDGCDLEFGPNLDPVTLDAFWIQGHMTNDYVGDIDQLPVGLVCDDSPWYREARVERRLFVP